MTDATRRGFVAGLLALAGCAGGQSGDGTPSTNTDATTAETTESTDTPTTENCHYEAKEVEHTGVLEVANETDGDVSFDATVRDSDGDAVFAHPVGADPGERNVAFTTSDGGDYTVEYRSEVGYDIVDWSVPDSSHTKHLVLVVTETDAGQTTVDAHTSTADPPATRVCE